MKSLLKLAFIQGQNSGLLAAKRIQDKMNTDDVKSELSQDAEYYASMKYGELWQKTPPQEEGLFLFKGQHSNLLSLITVVKQRDLFSDEYFGVVEMRGRSVQNLQGIFLDLENIY